MVLGIMGRGSGKSWVTGVFAGLYAILNPGVKIGLLSSNFRQSRAIFNSLEDVAKKPAGALFQQCFTGSPQHRNDEWIMNIGDSKIIALPLGSAGGKIRGYRFNVVIVDELLLIPESIMNEVILPFLSTNLDPRKRQYVIEEEKRLLNAGLIKESEMTVFTNPKLVGLSSASFKFEHLYKVYEDYIRMIQFPESNPLNENASGTLSYGVVQLSHDAIPDGLYNAKLIESAKISMSDAQFAREFGAQFTDDSAGYFSTKKMQAITADYGSAPFVEIRGDKKAEYIINLILSQNIIKPIWKEELFKNVACMKQKEIDFKRYLELNKRYCSIDGLYKNEYHEFKKLEKKLEIEED
jgi:hypothetical protein